MLTHAAGEERGRRIRASRSNVRLKLFRVVQGGDEEDASRHGCFTFARYSCAMPLVVSTPICAEFSVLSVPLWPKHRARNDALNLLQIQHAQRILDELAQSVAEGRAFRAVADAMIDAERHVHPRADAETAIVAHDRHPPR